MKLEADIRKDGFRVIAAYADALQDTRAFERALASASDYRKQKTLAYKFAKDRRLCLLAGMLLDELLGAHGLRESDMAYVEGAHGKPSFSGHADLHFSLAHSENMAVAALAQRAIGVDVEYLAGFPHDIADPHAWTSMESVGKLLGTGVGELVDQGALNSGSYSVPEGIQVDHIEFGDYLISIARETGLPLDKP